jgi:hypothetical protein
LSAYAAVIPTNPYHWRRTACKANAIRSIS